MKFGDFACAEALGVRLAHTLRLPGRVLHKGRVLDAADLADLAAADIASVSGARLDADERDEDSAAGEVAQLLAGAHLSPRPPGKGRCNIHAAVAGALVVDRTRIDRLNHIDEALTVGTLAPFAAVRAGQVVASIKAIPFAVSRGSLDTWHAIASGEPALRLAPFVAHRAALIMSSSASTSAKLFATTARVTRQRLEALGSTLALELVCPHDSAAVQGAIVEALAAGCDLLLISGATVSKDRGDVVPAAITAAGGSIKHFGMPVEPGNMLLFARIGSVPVLNLPGCARSRRENGLDWLLTRLLAKLPVTGSDIMGMGVGGLIRSAPGDHADEAEEEEAPPPEAILAPPPAPRIAALVLAAGRSTRMGGSNKLLCEIDGIPMLLRAVNAACASRCVQTLVVTGNEAARIEAMLAERPVSLAHNPAYADGLASSLRAGLRALPRDLDGVLVLLGDMPHITAAHIDRLLAAFDVQDPRVVVPERNGRRGNPVLWPRHLLPQLLHLQGDTGARALLDENPAAQTRVSFDDNAVFTDIDTPEALAELRRP